MTAVAALQGAFGRSSGATQGMVLMPVGLGCAVRSSAIFCDGSIDLTCAEALHAKKRLKTLNTNVNKPNLQRLLTNKVFWLHRSAMLTGTSRSEHGGNQGSTCTS